MGGRVVGVDVARFVALAGMMAIHVLPAFEDGEVTFSQSIAGGRASALFAVLAGVSISLAQGGRVVDARRWDRVAAGLVIRAGLIGLLGLWLGELHTTIAVILVYYGLLFVVAAPFLLVQTRTLLYAAAVWVVLGPFLSHLIRPTLPSRSGSSPSFESLERPFRLLSELAFTGFYPVFVWLAYLLVGLAVGRLDLRSIRTAATLAGVGAGLVGAAIVVSDLLVAREGVRERLSRDLSGSLGGTTPTDTWWWLAVRSAHSGTPFDLIQTIGSALLVLGVCLVAGRLLPRPSAVVFGAGAMTLTLYTLHVMLRQEGAWDAETVDVYVGHVLLALAIGSVFGLLRWRGPLEWVVSRASRSVQPKVSV
ncbi:MAG TPA: heparan-alpha-glucosaminide N-acetyltransferase domain-containing protein [Nocardioidaceae bacterium]|nr:heparan-alpha-glucosaminide N-acetyltransferase domain-containing protein [Nocardioidaceae bacterium]